MNAMIDEVEVLQADCSIPIFVVHLSIESGMITITTWRLRPWCINYRGGDVFLEKLFHGISHRFIVFKCHDALERDGRTCKREKRLYCPARHLHV